MCLPPSVVLSAPEPPPIDPELWRRERKLPSAPGGGPNTLETAYSYGWDRGFNLGMLVGGMVSLASAVVIPGVIFFVVWLVSRHTGCGLPGC